MLQDDYCTVFFFFDFFFFSGEVLVVLSIEAIDGVLTEGGIELIDKVFESDKASGVDWPFSIFMKQKF